MRLLILSNYFLPESVGAGIWVTQLARDLRTSGHDVSVLTSHPSYPDGQIFPGYHNRLTHHETIDCIEVIRTLTYATQSKSFWPRFASFGAFCLSAFPGYLPWRRRFDVVYAILPPLPLGVSAWAIAKASGARLVVNVQDIYPDIAVQLNYLANPTAIALFRRMERWIYRHSDLVVVISEGFRENLLAKGVPARKLRVVPNWADPEHITPSSRDNAFRRETRADGHFLVVYSGGLTHNCELEPVLTAAAEMRDQPIRFAIVGDGVHKQRLAGKARSLHLDNLQFYPFQPIDRYPEVLAAADATLVTLNSAATFASVPSKVFKQMAAARPLIAITNPGNELSRLIAEARCGVTVRPNNPGQLVEVLRGAIENPQVFVEMGRRARVSLERNYSRCVCVPRIESALAEACR